MMASLKLLLLAVAFIVTQVAAKADGLTDWAKINAVLSHPRCANCHTPDDRPHWFIKKTTLSVVHGMNVQRGLDGMGNTGLRCSNCHTEKNGVLEGMTPGAPNWHLAPASMVWLGQTSAQICAQIKDPLRNGNRTLDAIAQHILHDPLVAWGWQPGEGREPAPGSAQETFDALQRWADEGAPCPAQ